MADVKDKKMLIELSVQEDHFEFASSIDTALASAEDEYNELNVQIKESLETIKKLMNLYNKSWHPILKHNNI